MKISITPTVTISKNHLSNYGWKLFRCCCFSCPDFVRLFHRCHGTEFSIDIGLHIVRISKLNHQISLRQRSPGRVQLERLEIQPVRHCLAYQMWKKTYDFSTVNCMGIVTIASHCCGFFFLHCPLINLLFVPYVDALACVNI